MDQPSSSFDDDLIYNTILDQTSRADEDATLREREEREVAEAVSSIQDIERDEEREKEKEPPSYSQGRLVKARYYRDLQGISKTVTYPVPDFAPFDSKSPPGLDVEKPCSSNATQAVPLRKLTLKIGQKILRFRVVDAPDKDSSDWPAPSTSQWGTGMGTSSADNAPNAKALFCEQCEVQFESLEQWRRHVQHHNGLRFPCKHCTKSFTNQESLDIHVKLHSDERPFSCHVCRKQFTRINNFQMHMKLHESGRRHFCSLCGKWYRNETDMLNHQQQCYARQQGEIIPTDRPLRFQCSYCEKMFHHKRDKTIHERVHTGERPYSCGYCGRGFTQSQALTVHIRTHTGEKPYNCLICDASFRDTSALRKHEFHKHTSQLRTLSSPTYNSAAAIETEFSRPNY